MASPILIVGPQGYLASHLIDLLKKTDPTAILVGLGILPDRPEGIDAYYTQSDDLISAHPEFQTIFLLASYIPYGGYHVPSPEFVRSNIQLVAQLSLAYPQARIVFSSSVSVYGIPVTLPIDVHTPFNNPDLYGLSKIAGEAIVKNHPSYGILRFTSIIGQGMRAQTMVPKMIEAARSGAITVWGDGSRRQNYVDVRDAVAMCLAAAQAGHNLVALGAGEGGYSNLEVAHVLKEITGCRIDFTGEDKAPSFVYDTDESYRLLNFKPKFSLAQTLQDMIDWRPGA